jgi:hypothetical protein
MQVEIFTRRPRFKPRLVSGNSTEVVVMKKIDHSFRLFHSHELVCIVDDFTERFSLLLAQFEVSVNPARSDD